MISCNSSHPVLSVVVCQISTGSFFVRQTALEEILACRQRHSGHWLCLVFRGVFVPEMRFLLLGCDLSKSGIVRENWCIWHLYKHNSRSWGLVQFFVCVDPAWIWMKRKSTEQQSIPDPQNPEGRDWCMLYNKHNS